MKYSIGFSDRRKSVFNSQRRRTFGKTSKQSFSGLGFEKFRSIKKYASNNVKAKRNNITNPKGIKTPEFKKKVKKVAYIVFGVLFFLGCAGLIGAGIYLKQLGDSLPSPNELIQRKSDQSTQILDRNGNLLYTIYGDQNREFVSIDKIPEHTKKALLAAEDAEFYQHRGLDYLGIIKSLYQNIRGGVVVRGASTLTQQLVKTTLLYDILGKEAYERTLIRKIKEVLITMQVEQTFTKDQILQMYMNEVPLGGVNYGFQAAANSYFGKDVGELTLAESALLAGLIQSPGAYSPLYGSRPELAKERQMYVLNQLEQKSKLLGVSKEDIEAARNEELVYKSKRIDIKAPHFVFYVKDMLESEFGIREVEKGGLKVTTTLDPTLQSIAEEEIVKGTQAAKRYDVNNGAMVVLNPKNSQILAMVGSVDYWNTDDPKVDGNVNVTTSWRQMGSSVKPFVYLNAINKGYGPWMVVPDISNITFGNYKPTNWDNQYDGLMTSRKALVLSRNIPAVYTLQTGGIDGFLQLMEKLGVTGMGDKANYGLSIALGSAEMKLTEFTNAYATLANGGIKHDLVSILKVEDSSGKILKEYKENEGQRVIDEKEAYLVNWMICDLQGFNDRPDNKYYTVNGKKVCGKTGTTNGPKDLLTFLYNQSIVVGIWNGNNNGKEMPRAWATTVSLPLGNSFLRRVIDSYSEMSYNRPAGIMTTTVCTDTGATPEEGIDCKKEPSIYMSGRAPQLDKRKAIEVCTSNNQIPANLDAAKRYGLTSTKILITTTLENSLQVNAYRNYLNASGIYIFAQPEVGSCPLPLGPNNAPVVEIYKPTAGQQVVRGKNVEISGSVRYLESIVDFKVQFDGSDISGAKLNADGSYVVNYFVPGNTAPKSYSITVYAKDNYGKIDSKTVDVSVIDATSLIKISITSPSEGASVNNGTPIVATVSGGVVDSVSFSINGLPQPIVATQSGNVWSATIPNTAPTGSRTITASGKVGSTVIQGNSITVTIN